MTSKFIPYTPVRNCAGTKRVVTSVRKYITCGGEGESMSEGEDKGEGEGAQRAEGRAAGGVALSRDMR